MTTAEQQATSTFAKFQITNLQGLLGIPEGSSIAQAVDYLNKSSVLRDYLGERFVDMYVKVKHTEQARFYEEITELDYDWYLRNA